MGNKPVKIGLKLDQTTFEAGSVLTGRVYLSVTGQEGRRAQGVHLLLVGQEVSVVTHEVKHSSSGRRSSSSSTHQSYIEVERSTTSLVHLDVPLTTFESGTVEAGQYEYPFEWELPMDLPGTMRCQRDDSHCEVSYQLTAYLYSGRRSQTLWGGSMSPDASSVVNVCVVAKPAHLEDPKGIFMEPEQFPIRQCCFARRGHISLGWDADTAVASPRSSVQVGIAGTNASEVEVKHLRVRWMETVSWNARGHAKQVERILDESLIPVHVHQEWQPLDRRPPQHGGTRAYNNNSGVYASLNQNSPARVDSPQQVGSSNNDSGRSRLLSSLTIPPDARDSYQGRLIQVRHSLVVKACTSGGCCVTSPESCAMVYVQRQPPVADTTTATAVEETSQFDALSAMTTTTAATIVEPSAPLEDDENHVFVEANILPEDWSAQTADVVTLTVPSANILQDGPRATTLDNNNSPDHPSIATTTATTVSVLPTAPPESSLLLDEDNALTMDDLQQSLAVASNPLELVEEHWVCNPTIVTLLQNATPNQYVSLLQAMQHTPNVSKTPQVARAVAIVMDYNFTCNHVLASLWAMPPYLRMQVLKEVAPLASDLDKNQHRMEQQLDDNELLHFRAALR